MVKFVFLLLGIVPTFTSWEEAHKAAEKLENPVVVLYLSRSDCTFCRRFEKEVLSPVLASGLYDDVVIREIVLDNSEGSLLPFAETPTDLETRYNIVGTPTVIFLSGDGAEIAKRIVGYRGDDFAHYRLERSLTKVLGEQSLPLNLKSRPSYQSNLRLNFGPAD